MVMLERQYSHLENVCNLHLRGVCDNGTPSATPPWQRIACGGRRRTSKTYGGAA